MTAVARPPRGVVATRPAAPTLADDEYVGRHRAGDARARHAHALAATLALMLAWLPSAGARRGRHRQR